MEDRLAFRLLKIDRYAALISVGVVPGVGPRLAFERCRINGNVSLDARAARWSR